MADIKDIATEQSYVGNSALGGGTSGVITIDTKPVEELARFTMFANKADYDQRQKDVETKVGELSEFTKLDLNGTRAKDKDQLVSEWAEMQKAAAEYAEYTPTSQKDKVEKRLAYEQKLKQLSNNVNSANKRAIAYMVRLNGINSNGALDGVEKDQKLAKLNQEFDGTDITTPIAAEDVYSIEVPEIPKATDLNFDVTEKMPNGMLTTTNGVFDGSKADALAFSFLNGLNVEPLPANATPKQKEEYEARVRTYKKGGSALYTQGVDLLNAALADPKYKNDDGTINYDAIKANNKVAAGTLGVIDAWNNYAADVTTKIDNGSYFDKTGLQPVSTIINKDGFLQIDKTKPISAQQLVKAQMWANAQSDKKSQKYTQTNDAVDMYNAKTARIKANTDGAELKLREKQWEATQTGGETVKNGAFEFAKNTLSDMINLSDYKLADGSFVISPTRARQMNNEQLKYLGIAKPNDLGVVAVNPLALSETDAIVIDPSGKIRVMAKAVLDKDGIWSGKFDNTRSTTVTNIATNRLNEELKSAGAKELNSYLPQDLQDGSTVSVNSTGKTTTASSGAIALSGKIDPSTLKQGQSYNVGGKSYIWDGKKLKAQ